MWVSHACAHDKHLNFPYRKHFHSGSVRQVLVSTEIDCRCSDGFLNTGILANISESFFHRLRPTSCV